MHKSQYTKQVFICNVMKFKEKIQATFCGGGGIVVVSALEAF